MKEKDKLKNAEWLLARIRPGQLLLKYFIKPSRFTLDQVAKELKMPAQDIIEMRKITPKIAERFERCFGWPAQVLLTWQLLYDIENELYRQEERLEKFGLHVYNQEIFLVHIKNSIRGLKKDRALLKKLLPARLRSMR